MMKAPWLAVAVLVLLLALLTQATAAEKESLVTRGSSYVQELARDIMSKASTFFEEIKESAVGKAALSMYDKGTDYVASTYTTVVDKVSEKWENLKSS